MRARLLPLLAALIVLPSAGFAPVPKPRPKKAAEKELSVKDLEGAWSVASYEYRTVRGLNTKVLYDTVEIKGGKWVQKRQLPNGGRAQTAPYTITIDAGKSPATFDMEYSRANAGRLLISQTRKGLFRLEGDRLTVTYTSGAKGRPASVGGELAVSQYRWVLKRQRP